MADMKHVVNGNNVQIIPLSVEELAQRAVDEQTHLQEQADAAAAQSAVDDRMAQLAIALGITVDDVKFLSGRGPQASLVGQAAAGQRKPANG